MNPRARVDFDLLDASDAHDIKVPRPRILAFAHGIAPGEGS